MSIKTGDIAMWYATGQWADRWCKIEITSERDGGYISGKVIETHGFEENLGGTYDDWFVHRLVKVSPNES